MSVTPQVEPRARQPYVAVRAHVSMAELGELGVRFGEVFSWLGARGVPPAGAPFFRYRVIDMERDLEVDVGVPVATALAGDQSITADVLPAGQYATLTHTGHPSELLAATKTLLDWAAGQGLEFDMSPGENGEQWGSRLEIYLTDPDQEPDMSTWVTQLAFRLA
jgi:effector-binding domain-containing protein